MIFSFSKVTDQINFNNIIQHENTDYFIWNTSTMTGVCFSEYLDSRSLLTSLLMKKNVFVSDHFQEFPVKILKRVQIEENFIALKPEAQFFLKKINKTWHSWSDFYLEAQSWK